MTATTTSGTQVIGGKNYSWVLSGSNLIITLSGMACYNKDTTILTKINDIEQYVKIKDLMPGQLIKTHLHGYKPLKFLLYAKVITNTSDTDSMFLIKKTELNGLTEDLIVSGGYYILVDKIDESIRGLRRYKRIIKIDDKECLLACDYKLAIKLKENKIYDIYHLMLDGENERYGIYVNGGFLSESTSESILKKIKYFKKINMM